MRHAEVSRTLSCASQIRGSQKLNLLRAANQQGSVRRVLNPFVKHGREVGVREQCRTPQAFFIRRVYDANLGEGRRKGINGVGIPLKKNGGAYANTDFMQIAMLVLRGRLIRLSNIT